MKIKTEYKGCKLLVGAAVSEAAKMPQGVYILGELTKKQLIALRNLNVIPSDRITEVVAKNDDTTTK